VRTLERELERRTEVVSPYAGRVVELKVNPGEIVARNGPLFSLLPSGAAAGDALVAVLYVPPAEGKKVLEGMEVRVVPTSVKREEHGFMLGRVDAVAEVPATPEGMMRILKNSQLVTQLSHDHAPFEVLVRLRRDPSTESGYRWSSSDGPPTKIHVGTLCRAEIVTRRERPIVLLIPALKRFFDD
jgi:HlyD family secretion protein